MDKWADVPEGHFEAGNSTTECSGPAPEEFVADRVPAPGLTVQRYRQGSRMANTKTIVGLNCSTELVARHPCKPVRETIRVPSLTSPWSANRESWLRPFYHSDNKRPSAGGLESLAPGLTSRGAGWWPNPVAGYAQPTPISGPVLAHPFAARVQPGQPRSAELDGCNKNHSPN